MGFAVCESDKSKACDLYQVRDHHVSHIKIPVLILIVAPGRWEMNKNPQFLLHQLKKQYFWFSLVALGAYVP